MGKLSWKVRDGGIPPSKVSVNVCPNEDAAANATINPPNHNLWTISLALPQVRSQERRIAKFTIAAWGRNVKNPGNSGGRSELDRRFFWEVKDRRSEEHTSELQSRL